MPPKDMSIMPMCYYMDSNGEYKPIGHIDEAELTALSPESETERHYKAFSLEPMELEVKFKGNVGGLSVYLQTGNDLYLRFPKKLRRWRRRRKI